jgi:hypothetical protein
MLGEWGVNSPTATTVASSGMSKAEALASVATEIARFPQLKALVYWHAKMSGFYTDLSSDQAAMAEFKKLGKLPIFNQPVPYRT